MTNTVPPLWEDPEIEEINRLSARETPPVPAAARDRVSAPDVSAAPRAGGTREKTEAQAELLFNRLSKRYRHLKKWARRTGINAFRLYDRDIPEIPLMLELYGDAVSGALYTRPYEKDEREEERWLRAMKAAAARALDIPESHIFLKERRRMRQRRETGNQYGKMAAQNFYRDVHEGDMIFRVNLSDYLDTGLFLDARKKRAIIRAEAEGKRVLNLFAYTCSLSAAAAKGGAYRVDSVDLSGTYLDWGKVNFALNGIEVSRAEDFRARNESPRSSSFRSADVNPPGAREASPGGYSFIRSDVTLFLEQAAKKNLRWDIIILDAPSFSNSKKMRNTLDIRRDHAELIDMSLSLLSPGGKFWFSSNARAFTAKGLDLDAGRFSAYSVKDERPALTDEDFAGKKIPLCYTFTERKRM